VLLEDRAAVLGTETNNVHVVLAQPPLPMHCLVKNENQNPTDFDWCNWHDW